MPYENLGAEIKEGIGRVYFNDQFRYPSVTTVLQVVGDNTYLDDWREKVGAEFADKYTQEACDIGSAMHDDYEQYLSNKPLKECKTPEEKKARAMFKSSLVKFKQLFGEIVAQELCVVSHKYKIAGRFDLLCRTKSGKLVLLDFKNTKRDKKVEDIEVYKLQLAFYHRMLKETYPQYDVEEHIVFMVNREGFPKLFRFEVDAVDDVELMRVRGRFYRLFGM